MSEGERVFDHNQRVGVLPSQSFECAVEVVRGLAPPGIAPLSPCPARGLRLFEDDCGIRIGRIPKIATRVSRGRPSSAIRAASRQGRAHEAHSRHVAAGPR